ncbi:MAG TPA: lipocalin-like domain-containing protein [Candidatus Bathyarchaeia archaeon]|nr:lipocalin-like domain-containing protein [Candidatus Bathyarchaeia archaeon]
MNEGHTGSTLDSETAEHVANALWMSTFDPNQLPEKIAEKLVSKKNGSQAFGSRMRTYLDWLITHPQSHNPSYKRRYERLKAYCSELTAHQAYVMTSKFLGLNASQGFEPMPKAANLQFPRDHAPKPKTAVGWHFFVGSCWDEVGSEFGVEFMFFRVALLPPALAAELGLTDIENQVIELQLGISEAGGRHYQADPIVIAGTTGLIAFGLDPFRYELGKNRIASVRKGSFWPITTQAWGLQKGGEGPIELSVTLTFERGKEYLCQGNNGCMPCVDGMGTLYYSVPNIALARGSELRIDSRTVTLERGVFWFDHQWGFLLGNPQSDVLRAANNTKKPDPPGWDWFMAQFEGDRQLTMFAAHRSAYTSYYFQTGPEPPSTMQVDAAGKYMNEHSELINTWGTLTIREWVKGESSPNHALYPVTHTWHPNKWEFSFDANLPDELRAFTMVPIVDSGQTNFFANGSQYSEGAVYVRAKDGADIGRGFAESVEYADTGRAMFGLTGIDDARLQRLIRQTASSWPSRLWSTLYVFMHRRQLKDVLASQKGLEFFAKPTQ